MVTHIHILGYIRYAKNLRILGTGAFCLFLLLNFLTIFPIVKHTDDAEATFVPSTTSITIATGQGSANVDITPVNASGTFAKSDSNTSPNNTTASFDVTTNNYTGYTLKLLGNDATGNLTNASYSDTLASITTAINQSTFETGSSYTNKWGIKPDTVNSASNTDYLPAPTTSSEILMDTTSTANPSTAKNYSINLGAKVDYTKAVGTYTNTYSLVAVGNAASFTITYDAGGVTDITSGTMPANPTQGSTGDSYVTLDSAVPQRTGYTFAGWCNGTLSGTTANPGTTCTGTLITDGKFDLNQTTSNTVSLHATWTANKYTCTKQWFLESASGTFSSTPSGTETQSLDYNNTCTFQKTVTDYKGSTSSAGGVNTSVTNGAQGSTTCTLTTSGCTANLYFYRNTYTLTVSKGSNISSVSGGGAKMWGQSVSISATPTSTYRFSKWTASGTATGSFASATSASTTYTMPKGASTVTAAAVAVSFATAYSEAGKSLDSSYYKMQDMSSSICSKITNGQTATLRDRRTNENRTYTVAKINGVCWMTANLNLPGNITIYNTDSNITATSYKLPASSTSGFNSNTTAFVFNSGSTTCSSSSPCYSYYSFVAAAAGTNPSTDGQNAPSDICPKGWRLPKEAEYTTLRNTYTTGATLTAAPFVGVYAGYYFGGSFYNGGSRGYYWSSTAYDASNAYYLYLNSSSADVYLSNKGLGYSIRCVANS